MAHTKAQKAVKGNRNSPGKRLGIKIFGGAAVKPGNIIIRQRGTKVNAGDGVQLCRDYTIMALKTGVVHFYTQRGEQYVKVK